MTVNYRLITIFSSAVSAILCAVALAFLVTSITHYRAEDFFTATKTEDFTQLGTCVETVTDSQLTSLKYEKEDIKCNEKVDRGNRGNMRNTIAVSVHGLYYTHYNPDGKVKAFVGSVPPIYEAADITTALTHTTAAAITATVGGSAAELATLVADQNFHNGRIPDGVSFHTAYRALHYVAEQVVPVDCDSIYGLTNVDIMRNEYGELEYIEGIRDGRLNDVGDIKDTWPLRDVVVDCNDYETPTPGTFPIDAAAPVTDQQKALLHAHCHAQFLYASVGTLSGGGTFTVPLPGIEPGPSFLPYPHPEGFNSTSTYSMKARMFLGYRFGLSLFAYVPMALAVCFLLADAVAFFLAEITMPAVLEDLRKFSPTRLTFIRDSLVIAATTKASRRKRLAYGGMAFFLAVLFYLIFIAAPWGFVYTRLPRPICEEGAPDHAAADLGMWRGTHGGWKADWDATWYDLATLFTCLFVIILLPITTTGLGRNVNKQLGNGDQAQGRLYAKRIQDATQLVHTKRQYRTLMSTTIYILVLGVVVLLSGQAASGARFGMAWAEGVVGQEKDEFGVLIFDEKELSEAVYDQTVATLAVTVAVGLVFGGVIQRHLFGGVGCLSALAFFGWLVLVVVFALPLLVYASIRSIFHHDAANKDCSLFPRESHEFENDLCTSRYWTFLIGGGIFFVGVLIITALGLKEAIPAILKTRKRAAVPYNSGGRAKAPKKMSTYFREGPSKNVAAPLVEDDYFEEEEMVHGQQEQKHALGGYTSSDSFFNFKTKLSEGTDTNRFLYAPRMMGVPSAR